MVGEPLGRHVAAEADEHKDGRRGHGATDDPIVHDDADGLGIQAKLRVML